MRVALCISGQPRFVEYAYQNIKQTLIDPNNADVFVHCWYDESLIGKHFVNYAEWANGWNYSTQNSKYPAYVDKIIQKLYQPKKFIFENEKIIKDSIVPLDYILTTDNARHYSREYFVNMIYSSWLSIMKCNTLKEEYRLENDIQYDYVIRARFDSTLNRPVVCSQYDKNILWTDKKIHTLPPRMIEDWFGFSSNENMNIYSSAFNYIQRVVNDVNKIDKIFCSETLVYEMMSKMNINHIAISDLIHQPIRQNMIER